MQTNEIDQINIWSHFTFFSYPSIEYLICKVKLIRSPEIQVHNDPSLIIIWTISYCQYGPYYMGHIIWSMIWSGTYGIEIQDISEVKFKSWSLLVLYVTRGTPEHQAYPYGWILGFPWVWRRVTFENIDSRGSNRNWSRLF